MIPPEVLDRMAATLRGEIGPAVDDPFAKTQAFMASVVLAKLAGQLRRAEADARIADDERRAVTVALREQLAATPPAGLAAAVDALEGDGGDRAWSHLVEQLYAARPELGDDHADALLGIARAALRARLDRALAYSR